MQICIFQIFVIYHKYDHIAKWMVYDLQIMTITRI